MMGDRGRIIICSSQKDREESYDYFSSILLFFWIQVTDGGRTVGYVIPQTDREVMRSIWPILHILASDVGRTRYLAIPKYLEKCITMHYH